MSIALSEAGLVVSRGVDFERYIIGCKIYRQIQWLVWADYTYSINGDDFGHHRLLVETPLRIDVRHDHALGN